MVKASGFGGWGVGVGGWDVGAWVEVKSRDGAPGQVERACKHPAECAQPPLHVESPGLSTGVCQLQRKLQHNYSTSPSMTRVYTYICGGS